MIISHFPPSNITKCLVFAFDGIGDAISHYFPLCKILKREGKYVEVFTKSKETYFLVTCLPYVDKFTYVDNFTIFTSEFLNSFDEIYCLSTNNNVIEGFNNLKIKSGKLVNNLRGIDYRQYCPIWRLQIGNKRFNSDDLLFEIDWFKNYYKDFQCNDKTVVFNPFSSSPERTYLQYEKVKSILEYYGFDVRLIDFNEDIRTNIFLIKQAKYILTTDTSTLWIAKAVSHPHIYCFRTDLGPFSEIKLGVPHLLQKKCYIDMILPEEIVQGFFKKIY